MHKAIIVDVDGTLAQKHDGRGHFDWSLVGSDIPHEDIIELVNLYGTKASEDGKYYEYKIIVVSGREDTCRAETEEWLDRHCVLWDKLLMRKEGDYRQDAIVKKEIYEQHIRDRYSIRVVIDDRDQVVAMWRSLGLRVFQVAPGNF